MWRFHDHRDRAGLLARGPPGRSGRRARARFLPDRAPDDGNRRGTTSTIEPASAQVRRGRPGSPGSAGTSRGIRVDAQPLAVDPISHCGSTRGGPAPRQGSTTSPSAFPGTPRSMGSPGTSTRSATNTPACSARPSAGCCRGSTTRTATRSASTPCPSSSPPTTAAAPSWRRRRRPLPNDRDRQMRVRRAASTRPRTPQVPGGPKPAADRVAHRGPRVGRGRRAVTSNRAPGS